MPVFKDARKNLDVNKLNVNTVVVAQGITAPAFTGAPVLPTYTVATLPPFASNVGKLVICSNGDAGSICLALATSTAWVRIVLGAAVAIA